MSDAGATGAKQKFEKWTAQHGVLFWIALIIVGSVAAQIPGIGPVLFVALIGWGIWFQQVSRRRYVEPPATPQAVSVARVAPPQARVTHVNPPAGGVKVVGTDYYAGWGNKRGTGSVTLVREPRNPHDPNAVAVFLGTRQIGHIPRERAALIAPLLDASRQPRVGATARFETSRVTVTLPALAQPNLTPASGAHHLRAEIPWGRCVREFEIAFESEHRNEVAAVFREQGTTITPDGVAVKDLEAALTPSMHPSFPAVLIGAHWVGNVTDPNFAPYLAALATYAAEGRRLLVPANVWARNDFGTIRSNVRIYMPELNEMDAPGPMPDGAHVLLPHGRKVQVTEEELHHAEVVALLAGSPQQPVVATLHTLPPTTARSTRERVQVRVYGETVGVLTPHMSEHFLPLLKACEEEGVAVACHAVVKGNQLKADVELDTARAGDLDDAWISEHLWGAVLQREADTVIEASIATDEATELPTARRSADMWVDDDLTEAESPGEE